LPHVTKGCYHSQYNVIFFQDKVGSIERKRVLLIFLSEDSKNKDFYLKDLFLRTPRTKEVTSSRKEVWKVGGSTVELMAL
jgi:hypothetical protein